MMSPPRLVVVALLAASCARAALGQAGAVGGQESGGLALSGSSSGSFSAWADRGSAIVPKGSRPAYQGLAALDARAEAGAAGEDSRCAIEGRLSVDAASGEASYALRELWAEWRPVGPVALRLGRQRLGFGSGFGWNPANDLDPRRDAADPLAARSGIDAASLRVEAGQAAGFPLSLSLVAALPAGGADLGSGRLGAQFYAYLGGIEFMAVASASHLGEEDERWLAGGWATAGFGKLVLGIEGAYRRIPDRLVPGTGGAPLAEDGSFASLAATATLRLGDFTAVAEGYWDQAAYSRGELRSILGSSERAAWAQALLAPGTAGKAHALARLAWASGDLAASCGALVDLENGAFLAQAELALSTRGNATARIALSLPGGGSALDEDELGISGRLWGVRASVAVYF